MAPAKQAGHSLEQFREKHDKSYYIPKRIKAALEILGPNFLYEAEFCREAGVSTQDVAMYRDQFSDYIVETGATRSSRGKRCWFGDKKVAAKMRETQ